MKIIICMLRNQRQTVAWIDEVKDMGVEIYQDDTIVVYHATTREKAIKILQEGILRRPPTIPDSYGVYFSTSPSVGYDYGDGTVIKLRVSIYNLHPDDVFPGRRMDFYAVTKNGVYKPIKIIGVVDPEGKLLYLQNKI